jgi:hypothetical protein
MKMTPRLQKVALLAHITFAVGWFGAVLSYLALVIAGLTSPDLQLARSLYPAMELIGWYVLVPLSLAALLSGLVQSLFTQWGLFRHWWIVAKLALTIFALVILFQHMRDVSRMAHLAQALLFSPAHLRGDLLHAAGGLLVLFAAMALSVFKPWGMTPYGRRRASPLRTSSTSPPIPERAFVACRPQWARIVKIHVAHAIVIGLLLVALMHIAGMHLLAGFHQH